MYLLGHTEIQDINFSFCSAHESCAHCSSVAPFWCSGNIGRKAKSFSIMHFTSIYAGNFSSFMCIGTDSTGSAGKMHPVPATQPGQDCYFAAASFTIISTLLSCTKMVKIADMRNVCTTKNTPKCFKALRRDLPRMLL